MLKGSFEGGAEMRPDATYKINRITAVRQSYSKRFHALAKLNGIDSHLHFYAVCSTEQATLFLAVARL